jgi:hypothetical protein
MIASWFVVIELRLHIGFIASFCLRLVVLFLHLAEMILYLFSTLSKRTRTWRQFSFVRHQKDETAKQECHTAYDHRYTQCSRSNVPMLD